MAQRRSRKPVQMGAPVPSTALLEGKRVAFTGRLASMTRADAAALVRAHAGIFVATVNRRTAWLIVGQDGWPLQKDGRLTNKLRKARALQRVGHSLRILPEEDLLDRLGRSAPSQDVRRLHDTAQLSRLLKIPGDRLRRWVNTGLIGAVETRDGVGYFDYSQVVRARTLWELLQAGVTPQRLRRSIRQLQRWVGKGSEPLSQLAILEKSTQLLVRLDDGLAEPTGQRCFDFTAPQGEATVSLPQPGATADQWFDRGCDHEEAGRFPEAVQAYRQALLVGGPDASCCFNLANALSALGQREQAVERYYQAVELDGAFAQAWNNLGVVLSDLGKSAEAVAAFERALALDPGYADVRYNLADLMDETGADREALPHWQAYVRLDGHSEWVRHAHRRLNNTAT